MSKATLYRFCRTREQLIDRLFAHCAVLLLRSLDEAELEKGPPIEGLRRLIQGQMAHRELTSFLIYYWKPDSVTDPRAEETWNTFQDGMDAFFLRGQHEGAFRIDISAATLTETLLSLLSGLVDAERRGRVPRIGMATTVERLFLAGAVSAVK